MDDGRPTMDNVTSVVMTYKNVQLISDSTNYNLAIVGRPSSIVHYKLVTVRCQFYGKSKFINDFSRHGQDATSEARG